jgi:hypothetical protein
MTDIGHSWIDEKPSRGCAGLVRFVDASGLLANCGSTTREIAGHRSCY